jgi:hypothetical protein
VVQRACYKYRGLFYDTDVSPRTIVDNLLEDIALNRLILSNFSWYGWLEPVEISDDQITPAHDSG